MSNPQQPRPEAQEPQDASPRTPSPTGPDAPRSPFDGTPPPTDAPQQAGPQAPGAPSAAPGEPGTTALRAQQPPVPDAPATVPQAPPAGEHGTMMLKPGGAPGSGAGPAGADREPGTLFLAAQGAPAPPAPQAPRVPPQAVPAQAPQGPQVPPHPQGAGPHGGRGGYVSPFPVRGATFGGALAAEWTKIRSLRSTMWTLGVMVVLVVGVALLTALVLAGTDAHLQGESPLTFALFGMIFGQLCVLTLGVLVISGEYGTGSIRTTLTASPGRARVLTAKAVVFFLVAFVSSLVATVLAALVLQGILHQQTGVTPPGAEWLKATVGVSLFVAVLGLLSLAVGTLLRHSAGAITLMVGVVLLPPIVGLFMRVGPVARVGAWLLDWSVIVQLGAFYTSGPSGSGPDGWEPVWIMGGITAVVLAAAYGVLAKRDV
ncbi:ABC transporter permease subunit [Streptomyces sp. NPDC059740]|uniref:ABC transporter permease subunit n=1 Tax=Streptomyces sp. NPDC059740 TaxID=3346926 RepID=UPI00365B5DC4